MCPVFYPRVSKGPLPLRAFITAPAVPAAARRDARHCQLQRQAAAESHDLPLVHFAERPQKTQRSLRAPVDRRLKVTKEIAAGVVERTGAQRRHRQFADAVKLTPD